MGEQQSATASPPTVCETAGDEDCTCPDPLRLSMRTRPHPSGERRLRGVESRNADFAFGSTAGLHQLNLDAVDLPVELTCHTADDWVRHGRPFPDARDRLVQVPESATRNSQ
jgi:hypothetical protein